MSKHLLLLGFGSLVAIASIGVPVAARAKSRAALRTELAKLEAEGISVNPEGRSVTGPFAKPILAPLAVRVEALPSETKQLLVNRSGYPFKYPGLTETQVEVGLFKPVQLTKELREIATELDRVAEAKGWDNTPDDWKAARMSSPLMPLINVLRLRSGIAVVDGLQGRPEQAITGLKVVEHAADLLLQEPGTGSILSGIDLKCRVRYALRALLLAEDDPGAQKAYVELASNLKREQYAKWLLSSEFIAIAAVLSTNRPLKDYQSGTPAIEMSEYQLLSGKAREEALMEIASCFRQAAERCNAEGDGALIPILSQCSGSLSKRKEAGAQLAMSLLPKFAMGSRPFDELQESAVELEKARKAAVGR
jgi:hypothetical protein